MQRSCGTERGRAGASGRPRHLLRKCAVAWALVLSFGVSPAWGDEVDARPRADPSAAPVDLDSLLKLPDGFRGEVDTRQGATKLEWRGRFETARKEIETARRKLARAEKELDSVSESSSSWQVSAPGAANTENSPLSFRLRQEVKEQRGEIETVDRRLRALHVEADLAAVPADWRK